MSYVKTVWVDEQTPLNAKNLNHIEDGIEAVPVDASESRSSIVTKTVNIETDVDSHGNPIDRTNRVYGAFSSAFGSRNAVADTATEGGVFGGKNLLAGEDSLVAGYENEAYESQSLVGGYNNTSYARESIVWGDGISISAGDSHSTMLRTSAIFGKAHSVAWGGRANLVAGDSHTIGETVRYSTVCGQGNTVGNNCSWINMFGGDDNQTGDYISDTTMLGYANIANNPDATYDPDHVLTIGDLYMVGHNNTATRYKNAFIFGEANTAEYTPTAQSDYRKTKSHSYIVGHDNTTAQHNEVYMLGAGLSPSEDDQVLLGKYNANIEHCWLNVGCGEKKANGTITRKSVFAACQQGSDYWIMLGTTQLNKPSSGGTIATQEYVGGIVGDINAALDAINGTVV